MSYCYTPAAFYVVNGTIGLAILIRPHAATICYFISWAHDGTPMWRADNKKNTPDRWSPAGQSESSLKAPHG